MSLKYSTTTVKLRTIFKKSWRNSVMLEINGATPQLVQIYTPTRNLSRHFFTYVQRYCVHYILDLR